MVYDSGFPAATLRSLGISRVSRSVGLRKQKDTARRCGLPIRVLPRGGALYRRLSDVFHEPACTSEVVGTAHPLLLARGRKVFADSPWHGCAWPVYSRSLTGFPPGYMAPSWGAVSSGHLGYPAALALRRAPRSTIQRSTGALSGAARARVGTIASATLSTPLVRKGLW